ncbi:thiamine phosphate synthase [Pleomorphomonas diazotrophica]|uniref:Thiamine phosphate synthase n=1 Tax=Pleomorphomonas diazotrophica TaxID=1166257 RepID=A0A1I4R7K6_9HYPH|nr:thiamine phosphate synthase [Pleomorphomonas diazotrophica]PKR90133.1 thiamine phosphate synthase [Pleomorphomonas diazotrophica]SFM48282.1 thiamine-phosphate diphosphorylase [Pleomorphomonas diazotrophica]
MLDRFYLIIDRAAWLPRLLPLRLKLVQIRTKAPDIETRRREIHDSLALCKAAGAICVVNDHWREAIEFGAEWLHLGQEDLDTADLKAIRAAGIRLGVSTANRAELDRALAVDPDHVALGPIWSTVSKDDAAPASGPELLTEWKRITKKPLVAIGGISLDRAPICWEAGADSVAVISDVLSAASPEARMTEWLDAARAWEARA